jgi:hypothetical protein
MPTASPPSDGKVLRNVAADDSCFEIHRCSMFRGLFVLPLSADVRHTEGGACDPRGIDASPWGGKAGWCGASAAGDATPAVFAAMLNKTPVPGRCDRRSAVGGTTHVYRNAARHHGATPRHFAAVLHRGAVHRDGKIAALDRGAAPRHCAAARPLSRHAIGGSSAGCPSHPQARVGKIRSGDTPGVHQRYIHPGGTPRYPGNTQRESRGVGGTHWGTLRVNKDAE